jgi:Secretion system C-terminal sorting domain
MKNIYLTFVFFLTLNTILAQNRFSYRYDINNGIDKGSQISDYNDKLIIGSSANCFINQKQEFCYHFLSIDKSNGQEVILNTANYKSGLKGSFIISKDTIYNFTLNSLNQTTASNHRFELYRLIININKDGVDSLESFFFAGKPNQYNYGMTAFGANHLVFLIADYDTKELILYKIDKKGNVILKKVVNTNTTYYSFANIKVDQELNILISFIGTKKGEDQVFLTRPFLLKLDANGNKVFNKDYPEKNDAAGSHINEFAILKDTSYLYGFKADSNNPGHGGDTVARPPAIYALKKDGTLKWKRYLYALYSDGIKQLNSFCEAKNGDILCTGIREEINKKVRRNGWIVRLDKNGKIKWERSIRDERGLSNKVFTAGELYDITEGADGFIYAIGMYMDTFPNYKPSINNNNIWLVAVDSSGCFEPNCGEKQVVSNKEVEPLVNQEEQYKLYPNPVSEVIHILYINDFSEHHDIRYEIYNLQGQLVAQGAPKTGWDVIDISPPPLLSGQYVLRLKTSKINKTFLFTKI